MNQVRKFRAALYFVAFISALAPNILAKEKITEIKLSVSPSSTIRPNETAVIRAEFYGTKKKGFLDNLLGGGTEKKSKISTSKWKISLAKPQSGWLSKPFLFQKDGTKTKSGFGNFLRQGLGAASAKDSVLYTAPSKPGNYILKIAVGSLTKNITVTVSSSAPPNYAGERHVFLPRAKTADPYLYLAERYAPFIAQETWFNPRADYLTRFDYDGNWNGDDNWENLDRGSSQAFVYYTVMETKTHWFIQYNFFHARDYSDVCIIGTCHENDNEGVILTVRKNSSKFGELEVLETLAHNNIYSFSNDRKIKKRAHNIDGKIFLFNDKRPILFIEAGGHGVYGADYKASLFSSEKMAFNQNTGVTYIYKGQAEVPKHPNDRNVGYALLPIYDDLWKLGSREIGESNETFSNFYSYQPFGNRPAAKAKFIAGAFRGGTASKNMAKPFWAWHDRKTRKKKILNTGQWALDPAYAISKNLKFPKDRPVSTEYLFNPYLVSQKP